MFSSQDILALESSFSIWLMIWALNSMGVSLVAALADVHCVVFKSFSLLRYDDLFRDYLEFILLVGSDERHTNGQCGGT